MYELGLGIWKDGPGRKPESFFMPFQNDLSRLGRCGGRYGSTTSYCVKARSSTVMCSPTVGAGLGGMVLGGRCAGEDGMCGEGSHGVGGA
jgi:hypothetical protein